MIVEYKVVLIYTVYLFFAFDLLQAKKEVGKSEYNKFDKQQPVSFSASVLFADRGKKITRLQGGVFIKQGLLEIKATQAQLFFDSPDEKLTKIKAQGNVIIIRRAYDGVEEIKLLSKNATYLVFSGKLMLKENVVLYQVNTKVQADLLTYYTTKELLQMESVSGSISAGNKAKKQM